MARAAGLCLAIVVMLAISACQEAPEWEIGRARTAVRDLRTVARADRFAPAELETVEEALRAADKELAAQKARWPFSRDYSRALVLLTSIPPEAELVRASAETRRKQAEAEAREALEAARSAIAHARAAIMVVPVSDGGGAARRIGMEVESADRRIAEVENLLVGGDFVKAREVAGQILQQVNLTLRRLSHAGRR